ncbi:MAG: hypothetical protein HY301_06455 [Verrucomicrobia bacterium]|nr:hypothetical protein [Verrucomicrobiota bacterium]
MRFLRPCLFSLATLVVVGAARAADSPQVVRSVTGQFTVGASGAVLPSAIGTQVASGVGLIQLSPVLTVVSCERVKTAVLRQLRLTDTWQGRVAVTVVPATVHDQKPDILATLFADGWHYQVELPSEVRAENFVNALTQVVLLEMANRRAGEHCAELPRWLTEGMTQLVLATEPDSILHSGQLVSPAGVTGVHRNPRGVDPLANVRRVLSERPALTFDELSWPRAEHARGERLELYQDSALLFVHALLRLERGPVAMREFLGGLGANLNWQTSFLKTFNPPFGRLIDVEKWWAVTVATFTGRNQWQMWSPDVALEKLDEAVLVQVETRTVADGQAARTTVRLQTVVREWDAKRQKPALLAAGSRLAQMRHNVPPELVRLVDEYRVALDEFLTRRAKVDLAAGTRGQILPGTKQQASDAVKRLDALDVRREMWRREFSAATADRANPTPGSVP